MTLAHAGTLTAPKRGIRGVVVVIFTSITTQMA